MTQCLTPQRQLFFIALVCAAAVMMAYVMQHVFGVQPCQLCLIERYFYMGIGVVALLGATVVVPSQKHLLFLGLGLLFILGGMVATYHSGVQYGYFEAPAFCAPAQIDSTMSFEEMAKAIAATPVVHCNEISWSFMGLSMAVYNALLSYVLGLYCWILYRRFLRHA